MEEESKSAAEILRLKAEEKLKYIPLKSELNLSEIEPMRLIHELEVHQVELEMQYEELEQAKHEAELASEKYAELYDLAPSGYFTLTESGEILELNLCGSQMLGKERLLLKNRLFGLFISDDTRPTFNLFLKNIFKTKTKQTCDVTLSVNDTSPMHIHLTGILIKQGDRCLITAVDITQRRQVEDDLRQSEKRLRTITENAPNLILEVDNRGNIVYISKVLPGYKLEDVIGKNFCNWITPEFHDQMILTLEHVFNEGKTQSLKIRGLGEKSEIKWYLTNLSPVKLDSKVINAIIIATDITDQILAEEQHAAILQTAMDGFWIVDKSGYILEVNDTCCLMSGYTRDELLSMHVADMEAVENDDEVGSHIKKVIELGKDRFETRHKRKDGSIFDVEISTQYRPEEEHFVSFLRDITDRKRAEENLRQSEARHKLLAETMLQGVVHLNSDGEILSMNPAAELILGRNQTGFPGNSAEEEGHEIIRENGSSFPSEEHPSMVTLRTGQTLHDIVMGIYNPSLKEYRWISVDSVPLFRSGENKPYEVYAIFEDITERKRNEDDLNYHAGLLDNASDAVISTDVNFRVKSWNKSAERIYGWKSEETIGKIVSEILQTQYLTNLSREKAIKVLYANEIWEDEVIQKRKDKTSVNIHASVKLIKDKNGKAVGSVSVNRDITEMKKSEVILKQREEQYRSFFQNNNAVILLIDPETTEIKEANPAACKYYGWTHTDLCKKTVPDLNPLPVEEIIINLRKTKEEKSNHLFLKHRLANGELRDVEVYSGPIQLGESIMIYAIIYDITEQRKAEEEVIRAGKALKSSEEKFALIFEKSPYAISLSNISDGRIIDVNNAFENIFGFSKGEVIGKRSDELGINLNSELRKIILEEIKNKGYAHGYEEIFLNKSGKECIIRYNIDVVETGHQKYLLNTAEDITERKKSEELLVESEQRYRSLFEESNDAIFLIDLTNGSYKDCNRLAEKLTGYTHEEILTMRIGSLLPPQRKSEAASNVEFILSHNVLRNETEIFTKDGEIVPVEFNSSKVEINQKQYILSMLHDISDRKAAEESLKQSEEALKKAQEIAHIGSWSLDLEKNQLTWSDEMYRIFGVPPLEFPATYEGFLDSVHPEDLDKVNTAYTNSILEGKETYEIDHRIIRKNSGEIRHILEKCEHVRDASGKIIGSVGMSHDITEQKQAEEALKQLNEVLEERILERTEELLDLNETLKITEEKYRTVADFTTNWEFWISPGDQMIYSSPSCERITGYSVADFVMNPQLLIDIIHPEDLPMYLEHKKQEKQTQACLHEIRFRIVRKDGSIRWIGHFCQPVFDESGQFRGIRGSNKDINARKKGEELLKKSNLKYSLLSANITDGIFIFRDGCFEYVNRGMNHIFGYQGTELIGLGLNQLILPEYANELDFMQTVPPMSQKRSVEIECVRKDQSVITVEFLFNYIAAENVIYGVAHDITEKKQIQKNIVKAIILTEEKERTYFSKELHDGLGPLLSTIKLYLEWSKEATNKQTRVEIVGKAEEIIEESIRTVKEISNKLSPHILINFGLCSAIQNFTDKLSDTSAIKIKYDCKINKRMGNEIEAAIYRATIECINNTLKYSGAKNIIIRLYEENDQLLWLYQDDGIGFDLKETIALKKGLGLFNLQNRIQNIGGKIKMFSKPGKGVEYRIVVNI